MALTEKQRRFVAEYLVDLNAAKAAERAGYKDPNIGRQLIAKNNVSEAIREAVHRRERRTEITADRVVEELAKVGFSEAHDYNGAELKVGNKLRALELLGRHIGLFDGRAQGERQENNLLDMIASSAEGDIGTDDLPEVQ